MTPEKAITKTVEIGTLEGRIDFTQLLIEWVTLLLVGSGLLLLFKAPNGSVRLATRETPAP